MLEKNDDFDKNRDYLNNNTNTFTATATTLPCMVQMTTIIMAPWLHHSL
jgi:hypothetical protein